MHEPAGGGWRPIISTLLSDGFIAPQQRITWWYASPRNGHISLPSKQSLAILAASYGFKLGGFSAGPHATWSTVPPWAGNFIRTGWGASAAEIAGETPHRAYFSSGWSAGKCLEYQSASLCRTDLIDTWSSGRGWISLSYTIRR